MRKERWYEALLLLTPFLFLLDRTLKWVARDTAGAGLSPQPIAPLIPKLLYFTYFENDDLAFGIPLLFPHVVAALIGAVFVATIFGLARALHKKRTAECAAFLLLIAGGVSNALDRVRFGATLDYLFFPPLSYFNLADILIIGGVCLLFLKSSREARRGARNPL